MLNLTWHIVSWTSKQLVVQLKFGDAMLVSFNAVPDHLLVAFNDLGLFLGTNGLQIQKENRSLLRKIPTQLTDAQKGIQEWIKKRLLPLQIATAASSVVLEFLTSFSI